MIKNLPPIQETWVWFLSWEDPLEKGRATHCNILACRIPGTEKPCGPQSVVSQSSTPEKLTHKFRTKTWQFLNLGIENLSWANKKNLCEIFFLTDRKETLSIFPNIFKKYLERAVHHRYRVNSKESWERKNHPSGSQHVARLPSVLCCRRMLAWRHMCSTRDTQCGHYEQRKGIIFYYKLAP